MKLEILSAIVFLAFVQSQKLTNQWNNRNTIVHLFEWKFEDVAKECERFLQHKGFGGVQLSPVNENLIIKTRPWWERYQPMSYKILSRSGNEAQFLDMSKRCNAVGIRLYIDVIANHMAADAENATGTGGSVANPTEFHFPAVPYTVKDFNSECTINNYNNSENVRNCQLNSLKDLNQGSEYVREKLLEYLNRLIKLGVAGFRFDAAKHMWPADLKQIYNSLHNLNASFGFENGSRPYIYQEVIDLGGEAISKTEYTPLGAVTEFKYGASLGGVFRGENKLTYLENWGPEWGLIKNSEDALVFIENHDNQRGHGAGGASILTYKVPKQYKMAIAFMLAHPYGSTRIMSSYAFENTDAGPPQDTSGNIISPIIEKEMCKNGWVCEHRWRQIYNMIAFKNTVRGTNINNWWSNGDQQIAFCRGNKGFIAFTNKGNINRMMQTCLPKGKYCDIISGGKIRKGCSGKTIDVNNKGLANINLNDNETDGVLAIHIDASI